MKVRKTKPHAALCNKHLHLNLEKRMRLSRISPCQEIPDRRLRIPLAPPGGKERAHRGQEEEAGDAARGPAAGELASSLKGASSLIGTSSLIGASF